MLPQIRLDRTLSAPLHQQLSGELRRVILSGQLQPGQRLPPTREAAANFGVSRSLVVQSYEQLTVEGYLESGVGRGTWVSTSIPPHLLKPEAPPRVSVVQHERRGGLSDRGALIASSRSGISASRPTFPLRPAAVAADLFPERAWLQCLTKAWRDRHAEMVHYGEVQGFLPLREALADHLRRYRAVSVDPDQVIMTSGSQQSLDLVARMLTDPGDPVGMENPGYDGAISAFRAAGASLVPIPVDDHGACLPPLDSSASFRVLYLTPSHQYPWGSTLPLDRRLAALEWASEQNGWIIEDDYDSEFRYDARPLPSLQGLDREDRVVYVGTLSKVLGPALRLGYIVLPRDLVEPFLRARQVLDHHPPISLQAALASFIEEGHFEQHVARMREVYRERRNALREAVDQILGDVAACRTEDGGLHLTLEVPDIDDVRVHELAFRRGIDPQPLSPHFITQEVRTGFVLGYGGFPPDRLRGAVDVLADVLSRDADFRRT